MLFSCVVVISLVFVLILFAFLFFSFCVFVIYRLSQKKYPLLTGNRNETIRHHYSPSGQLNSGSAEGAGGETAIQLISDV